MDDTGIYDLMRECVSNERIVRIMYVLDVEEG